MDTHEYLQNRLKDQLTWYDTKATFNKRVFMNFQMTIIILGAVIPLVVVLAPIGRHLFPTLPFGLTGAISAIISATISIIAGIDKLTQPQTNWYNYRAVEENLKKEEWFYKFKAGGYKGLDEKEASIVLVERVESIIAADIARFIQPNATIKPKPDAPISDTTTPGPVPATTV
jgi:hypothetical protein